MIPLRRCLENLRWGIARLLTMNSIGEDAPWKLVKRKGLMAGEVVSSGIRGGPYLHCCSESGSEKVNGGWELF